MRGLLLLAALLVAPVHASYFMGGEPTDVELIWHDLEYDPQTYPVEGVEPLELVNGEFIMLTTDGFYYYMTTSSGTQQALDEIYRPIAIEAMQDFAKRFEYWYREYR